MSFRTSPSYDFWRTEWRSVGAVYGIRDRNGSMIYVGQTDNLQERMDCHRNNLRHCMHGYSPSTVVIEAISDSELRLARERYLISEYDPPCNKI